MKNEILNYSPTARSFETGRFYDEAQVLEFRLVRAEYDKDFEGWKLVYFMRDRSRHLAKELIFHYCIEGRERTGDEILAKYDETDNRDLMTNEFPLIHSIDLDDSAKANEAVLNTAADDYDSRECGGYSCITNFANDRRVDVTCVVFDEVHGHLFKLNLDDSEIDFGDYINAGIIYGVSHRQAALVIDQFLRGSRVLIPAASGFAPGPEAGFVVEKYADQIANGSNKDWLLYDLGGE
jgi:hypothetical protein